MNNSHFVQEIRKRFGISIDKDISFDGLTFERFDADKSGDRAIWVKGFPDGNVIAGNWKTGETIFLPAEGGKSDPDYCRTLLEKTKKEIEELHAESKTKAKALYENLPAASADQAYIVKKGIKVVDGVKQEGHSLVIPGYDSKGGIQTLQHILPNGEKRFFPGCQTTGAFFIIGSVTDKMFLVEGYATGCSVSAATGLGVVVAFNAGNLSSAAISFHTAHPEVQLTVVADNDAPQKGAAKGIGELKAQKTGLPYVLIPIVGMDANDYLSAGYDLKTLLMAKGPSQENPLGLIYDYDMVKDLADLGWLIKGWIPRSSLTMIYGPPACGKSTLIVDLFMSYACGISAWNGNEIDHQGGLSVYLCGEGYPGLIKRKLAWEQVHGVTSVEKCVFSKKMLKLNREEGYLETVTALKALGKPIDLVVIDTFRRAYEGDENDAGGTEAFFSAMQNLSEELGGAAIIVIHHSGKTAKGPRGSSNHAASVDVLMAVERDTKNNTIRITQEKQKDSEELEPAFFCMRSLELENVRDSSGDFMSAPYVIPVDEEEKAEILAEKVSSRKNDGLSLFKKMWKGTMRHLDGELEDLPFVSIADFLDYYITSKGLQKRSASNYLRPERCPFSELLIEGSIRWEEEGFYLKNTSLLGAESKIPEEDQGGVVSNE